MTKKLGEVCTCIGGGTPAKNNPRFYTGRIPWATVRDLRNDIIASTEFYITQDALKNSASNIIPAGNVIIATRVGLGKVCIAGCDVAINQDLKGIIPRDRNQIDTIFLFLWFKSVAQRIINEGTGATVQGVKLSFINSLLLPIPPISEQQRIVAILDAAFADLAQAKSNAEKNLANAKELFASELNTIFTRKGEGWEETTLGNVCDVMTGPFGSLLHKSEYVLSGYPVVNPADIAENYISTEKIKYVDTKIVQRLASYRVHENDILIGRRGDIGRCAVVQKEHEGWLCGTGCFIARPNKETDGNFIASFIRSDVGCEYLNKIATGTTMLNLSNSNLRSLPLNIPKLKDQQRIVSRLDELSEHCKNLEAVYTQKLSLYDEVKQSLLHKAFSGDL